MRQRMQRALVAALIVGAGLSGPAGAADRGVHFTQRAINALPDGSRIKKEAQQLAMLIRPEDVQQIPDLADNTHIGCSLQVWEGDKPRKNAKFAATVQLGSVQLTGQIAEVRTFSSTLKAGKDGAAVWDLPVTAANVEQWMSGLFAVLTFELRGKNNKKASQFEGQCWAAFREPCVEDGGYACLGRFAVEVPGWELFESSPNQHRATFFNGATDLLVEIVNTCPAGGWYLTAGRTGGTTGFTAMAVDQWTGDVAALSTPDDAVHLSGCP